MIFAIVWMLTSLPRNSKARLSRTSKTVYLHICLSSLTTRRDSDTEVYPALDSIPIVEDEEEGDKGDEDGEKPAGLGPGLVGGRELGESIELGERGGDEVVELVEQRLSGRIRGLGHCRHRRRVGGGRRRDGERLLPARPRRDEGEKEEEEV